MNHESSARFASIFALLFLLPCGASAQQGACLEVYKGATRNYEESRVRQIEKREMFDRICTKSGETNDTALKHDGSWDFYGLMESNWDYRKDKSKWQEFCKEGKSYGYDDNTEITIVDRPAVEALQSFNQCRALELQDILITANPGLGPEGVTINVQIKSNVARPTLDAVETSSNMTCDSASLDAKSKVRKLSGSMQIPIVKDFNISCKRKFEKVRGNKFYRAGFVQLATSYGAYNVYLPEDEHLGFWTARKNAELFRGVEAQRESAIVARNEFAARAELLGKREAESKLMCNGSGTTHIQDVSYPPACPEGWRVRSPAPDEMRSFVGPGGCCGRGWKCLLCERIVDPKN